ncbi:MAG: hypothetical protein HQM10_21415 [Candidatus Riflebacteria bacterium]|nr:hypothetical protein [Candidatus Riflebacteria bacterium]
MRINQNVLSIQTHSTLQQTNTRLEKSIEKLSSGLRINRAADDAAGLAISEKLRRQIKGLTRAISNSQDGISMIQTAEGALGESHSILQRMRELAIQAANDTLTTNDRLEIQKEVNQLKDDINRISRNTEFNTKKLLDGTQTAIISGSSNAAKGIVTGDIGGVSGNYDVSITLEQGGTSQLQQSQVFTKYQSGSTSNIAKGSDQLKDIAQFYDANGVFVLTNPATLTVQGNGGSTSFVIDGHTTLDQLAANMQGAISGASGLQMGTASAKYVPTTTSNPTVGGYLQIDSGLVGSEGKVNFLADQPIINALNLSTVREAANNVYSVQIKNASGYGQKVYSDTNRVSGLLNGVDVAFESQAAQVAGLGGVVDGLHFTSTTHITISVAGQAINITINADTDWTMEGLERYFNRRIATAGVSGVSAAIVDGELRMMFTPPSNYTGNTTLRVVNDTNGGENTLGLEDGVYTGFVQSSKLESAIAKMVSKYYDGADATSVVITISSGDADEEITVFATVSSLSSADGVQFSALQVDVNTQLKSGGVSARLDVVQSTLVFSSTRVGNVNSSTISSSKLTMVAGSAGASLAQASAAVSFLQDWGFSSIQNLDPIVSKGKGDSNFRLNIVNSNSQLQIGADQGQTMKFGMVDMGAEALGVDNLNMTSINGANEALSKINLAIDKVSAERSKLGAFQNRLEYAINNLRTMHSNASSAESRIRDADIAQEMIEFTRNQIVAQSGTAMLAQANTVPQSVMQLLR